MDAHAALERLRKLLPPQVGVEEDAGELHVYVRRDMLHLDADALNDRLHHWTLRELSRAVPDASAHVSFRRARPAAPDEESVLDLQEGWLGLEPTLKLDATRGVDEATLDAFVAQLPRFIALLETSGRPAGFRRVDVGTME